MSEFYYCTVPKPLPPSPSCIGGLAGVAADFATGGALTVLSTVAGAGAAVMRYWGPDVAQEQKQFWAAVEKAMDFDDRVNRQIRRDNTIAKDHQKKKSKRKTR